MLLPEVPNEDWARVKAGNVTRQTGTDAWSLGVNSGRFMVEAGERAVGSEINSDKVVMGAVLNRSLFPTTMSSFRLFFRSGLCISGPLLRIQTHPSRSVQHCGFLADSSTRPEALLPLWPVFDVPRTPRRSCPYRTRRPVRVSPPRRGCVGLCP
jgi:hypothetical protein